MARHTCDNPPCCNPRHLIEGTFADNSRDASGRHRLSPQTNPERYRGERHYAHRLTRDQVREIRERYAAGHVTQAVLGAEYGVRQAAISKVVLNQRWRAA